VSLSGALPVDVDDEEELPLTQGISFRREIVGLPPTNGHHLHHQHIPGSYHTMTFNNHRHQQQVTHFRIEPLITPEAIL